MDRAVSRFLAILRRGDLPGAIFRKTRGTLTWLRRTVIIGGLDQSLAQPPRTPFVLKGRTPACEAAATISRQQRQTVLIRPANGRLARDDLAVGQDQRNAENEQRCRRAFCPGHSFEPKGERAAGEQQPQ